MKPTDRQRVLRFLGDPPAARTRDEIIIMLTCLVFWDEEDLPEEDAAKVDAAEELLHEMVTAGELSFTASAETFGDGRPRRAWDLFGPPENAR
jgi:hypothetical protein